MLLFVLFAIIVIVVVTGQLSFSSSIDHQIATNTVQELQMEELARAGIQRGRAALLVDLDDDSKGDGSSSDPMSGMGGDSGSGTGSAPDSGGSGKQKNNGPHVDSLDELWASEGVTMQLGQEGGFQTKILITDEDSKLNLLLLLAEDEDYRKLWHDRFVRALDLMRDGLPGDLTNGEASDYVDRFTAWMQGDRANDELAIAPIATGQWKATGSDRSNYAPLTLREFTLTGVVSDSLYYGFPYGKDEDRRWVPGFDQTLTVWSNVEYKDATTEQNEENAQNSNQDSQPPPGAAPPDRPEAAGMNNGRLNVNTTPIWILKSLFADSDLATSAWDDYENFRKKTVDDKKKERENFSGDSSTTNQQNQDQPGPTDPIYPLKTIDDLKRFKGFSNDGGITPDAWNKLAELLSVESNVFTITVLVGTTELPRRFYVGRSVVWRRGGGADQPCIPIVEFEKLPLSAVDLDAFSKELDSFSNSR